MGSRYGVRSAGFRAIIEFGDGDVRSQGGEKEDWMYEYLTGRFEYEGEKAPSQKVADMLLMLC